MRLRKIRKIGNSYFIALSMADMKDKKWKEGKELDIDDFKEKQKK